MSLKSLTKVALILIVALLAGCRGSESKQPPIHLNPNMDLQEKYKAQEESSFFANGTTLREPVEGTVPHSDMYLRDGADFLKADSSFYEGLNSTGQFVTELPALADLGFKDQKGLLLRGQQRYNIYCAPCHSQNGNGKGLVSAEVRGVENGFTGIANLTSPEYVAAGNPVGKLYQVIKNGSGQMPSYAYQVKVRDRWAIVAYVKVLQEAAAKAAQNKSNN
jgi:mono/diheme cytochrome c family protein